MTGQPTGAVTFLFTDIEGSTRLWEEQPEVMQRVIERHDALLREQIGANGGYVFTTAGDAFSAAFSDPRDALAAAIAAQQALSEEPWDVGRIRVRMGLHSGVAHERDGDYFGPTLNRAARIMSAGHGGQVLVSQASRDLLTGRLGPATELRSLGEHRLKDLGSPEHLYQLLHPNLDREFAELKTLNAHLNNLPVELSSFVGRHDELEETVKRLRDSRLVTLTGVGGSGKTRLALQTAAEMFDQFPDGLWVAEMAGLAESDGFARWVAEEMAITRAGTAMSGAGGEQRPIEVIQEFLNPRTSLLVLDNCEHLISAAADFADHLLKACPNLKILCTSREGLGIRGEYLIQVPSLALPKGPDLSIDEGGYPDAMELFAERASAVNARFELNHETARAVADICRRLDGMPLAIELAAARARMLTVDQISERLSDTFRLLTGGSRTALPRQQTLLATVDWSYNLLSEQEKALFSRLAVFRGGFSLEAAEAVVAGEGIDEFEVFEILASLVDKSMIQGGSDSGRFGLLETLRQYALGKLVDAGEGDRWRRRHGEHYVTVAEEAYGLTRSSAQADWFARLERDHDNVKAALTWTIESSNLEMASRMARGVWWFWSAHQHGDLGIAFLDQILDHEETLSVDMRADLYSARSRLKAFAVSAEAAVEDADKAEDLARESGSDQVLARALLAKVGALIGVGHHDTAHDLARQGLEAAERAGDEWAMGWHTMWRAWSYRMQSAVDEADRWLEESKRHFRTVGVLLGLSVVLTTQGIMRRYRDDFDDSIRLHQEAIEIGHKLGDRGMLQFNLILIGISLHQSGRTPEAIEFVEEGLQVARDLGPPSAETQTVLAMMQIEVGDLPGALRSMKVAGSVLATTDASSMPVVADHLGDLCREVGLYRDAAVLEAYSIGERVRVARPVPAQFQPERDKTMAAISENVPDWASIEAEWLRKEAKDIKPVILEVLARVEDALSG